MGEWKIKSKDCLNYYDKKEIEEVSFVIVWLRIS